jgi:hypothetical protein
MVGSPPLSRTRRGLVADESRLYLESVADGELRWTEFFSRLPIGLYPRKPHGESLYLQYYGGLVFRERHPVASGLWEGRFRGGWQDRHPWIRGRLYLAASDQRCLVLLPRVNHDRTRTKRRGLHVREPMVQGVRLQSALFRFVQLPVEILDGPTHHETPDPGVDPLHVRNLAAEPGNLYPHHGFCGIRCGVRDIPGVSGHCSLVLCVLETAARGRDLAGPVSGDRRQRSGLEPNEGVPSLRTGWNRRAVRMGLLGGHWFDRGTTGRGGPIGAHDTEPNHHGLLHGALFFRNSPRHTDGKFPTVVGATDPGVRPFDLVVFDDPVWTGYDCCLRLPRRNRGSLYHRRIRQRIGRCHLVEGLAVQSEHCHIWHNGGHCHRARETVVTGRHQLCLPVVVRSADDYYTAIVRDKGLDAAWFWMNIPYLCMNVTLFVMFVFTDWHQIQEQILLAGEKKNTEDNDDNDDQQGGPAVANERTSLL